MIKKNKTRVVNKNVPIKNPKACAHNWSRNHHESGSSSCSSPSGTSHPHNMHDKCTKCKTCQSGSGQASWSEYVSGCSIECYDNVRCSRCDTWLRYETHHHSGGASATCTTSAKCKCGSTSIGNSLGHDFISSEQYCRRSGCSAVNPNYKPPTHEHDWRWTDWQPNGSTGCKRLKYCAGSTCNVSNEEKKSHRFNALDECLDCGYKKPQPPKDPKPTLNGWTTSSTHNSLSASASIKGNWTGSKIGVQGVSQDSNKISITQDGLSPNTNYTVVLEIWNGNSDVLTETVSIKTKPTPNPPSIKTHRGWAEIIGTNNHVGYVEATTAYGQTYVVELTNSSLGYHQSSSGSLGSQNISVSFSNLRPKTTYNYKIMVANTHQNMATATGSLTTKSGEPLINEMGIYDTGQNWAKAWVTVINATPTNVIWYLNGSTVASGTSLEYTFTGLKSSTTYYAECEVRNQYGGHKKGISFDTKQGKFQWGQAGGGGSGVGGKFVKGDLFTMLTAGEWNNLMTAISRVYTTQGLGTANLPHFKKGEKLTASQYNIVLGVLRRIRGVGVVPSNVVYNQVIEAEKHINALADAINKAIPNT